MTPFGKIIFSLIGFKIWGFSGFLWGMFLGHVLIDRSILNQIIKRKLNRLEDTIRLVLPYRFYPVLDFIDRLFDNRFFKKFKHKLDIFWDRNLIKIQDKKILCISRGLFNSYYFVESKICTVWIMAFAAPSIPSLLLSTHRL